MWDICTSIYGNVIVVTQTEQPVNAIVYGFGH